MVGRKVAIVSDKPQTTRRAIRGVVTAPERLPARADRPARRAAPARRADRAHAAARGVRAGRGRRGAVRRQRRPGRRRRRATASSPRRWARASVPVAIAVNKVDRLNHTRTVQALTIAAELGLPEAEVFPISARTGRGVPALVDYLAGLLPEGPFYFPPEDVSDQPEDVDARRAGARAGPARAPARRSRTPSRCRSRRSRSARASIAVRATMWVETESQKGILIGAPRAHDQGDRHRGAARRSSASSASTCTWTCPCACAAPGGPTTRSWTASASPTNGSLSGSARSR